ncbi:MAG: hypothetical protein RLZZ292_2916 [Bacteroidota bacterium]|jgi:hypothetical protein
MKKNILFFVLFLSSLVIQAQETFPFTFKIHPTAWAFGYRNIGAEFGLTPTSNLTMGIFRQNDHERFSFTSKTTGIGYRLGYKWFKNTHTFTDFKFMYYNEVQVRYKKYRALALKTDFVRDGIIRTTQDVTEHLPELAYLLGMQVHRKRLMLDLYVGVDYMLQKTTSEIVDSQNPMEIGHFLVGSKSKFRLPVGFALGYRFGGKG